MYNIIMNKLVLYIPSQQLYIENYGKNKMINCMDQRPTTYNSGCHKS